MTEDSVDSCVGIRGFVGLPSEKGEGWKVLESARKKKRGGGTSSGWDGYSRDVADEGRAQDLFDLAAERGLREISIDLVDRLPFAEELQRRKALHSVPLRQVRLLVHVDLHELQAAREFGCEPLKGGRELAAPAAPRRPEVHEDDVPSVQDFVPVALVCFDVVYHHTPRLVRKGVPSRSADGQLGPALVADIALPEEAAELHRTAVVDRAPAARGSRRGHRDPHSLHQLLPRLQEVRPQILGEFR